MTLRIPSWADILNAIGLDSAEVLRQIHAALDALPPGATHDQIQAEIDAQVNALFSAAAIEAAKLVVSSGIGPFFLAGGRGPVEKAPTDVLPG